MKASHLGFVAVAAVLTAATGAYIWQNQDPADSNRLQSDQPSIVAAGAEIYKAQCAACHGADLQGQPDWQKPRADGRLPAPPHDEDGHTWHHPDELLFAITKLGTAQALNQPDFQSDMPAFGPVLSDTEIVATLSYIKSRWPEPIRKRHDTLNRRVEAARNKR